MDNRWLTGFIEGEGCFSISFTKTKNTKFGYQIKAIFAIKITKSERQVLEEIRKHLKNIGNIYSESSERSKLNVLENANDCVSFRVTKIEELQRIIKLLEIEKFVSIQKREDFENWVKCVSILEKKNHLTKKGFLKIAELREQMHKRKQSNKKSYCEIKNHIDPCEIYKITKKIPINCNKCKKIKRKIIT